MRPSPPLGRSSTRTSPSPTAKPAPPIRTGNTELDAGEVAIAIRGDEAAPVVVPDTGQGQGVPVGSLAVFLYRVSIVAAWARVALPLGAKEPSP